MATHVLTFIFGVRMDRELNLGGRHSEKGTVWRDENFRLHLDRGVWEQIVLLCMLHSTRVDKLLVDWSLLISALLDMTVTFVRVRDPDFNLCCQVGLAL